MSDDPTRVTLRRLHGDAHETRAVQRLLEAAPGYAWRTTGRAVGSAEAQDLFTALPPGKTVDDKFVFGIQERSAMVGCVDLIRGYPDPSTAHLGLLLVAEGHEGRGIGRAAVDAVIRVARSWSGCTRLRLGVVRTNDRVLGFWSRLGFVPTGEGKPYRNGAIVSQTIVLARSLDASPPTIIAS